MEQKINNQEVIEKLCMTLDTYTDELVVAGSAAGEHALFSTFKGDSEAATILIFHILKNVCQQTETSLAGVIMDLMGYGVGKGVITADELLVILDKTTEEEKERVKTFCENIKKDYENVEGE